MPANNQKPPQQPPASPRNTSKYTNKDGSKFITVPKGADSSQPSTPSASITTFEQPAEPAPAPVNRKKQKRREKAAAKAAAAQNGHPPPAPPPASESIPAEYYEEVPSEDDEEYEYVLESELTNGHPTPGSASKKTKKKKKKKNAVATVDPGPPRGTGMSRDKIWSTSNQEERERIKEFWLGLREDERKSLVKVEKDAVLRKMKEQQKHTCSCTVCGRKRTAIEEELEGLYDAYYLELEQFANQGEGPPMLPPPPRDFSAPFRSPYPPPPSRGRIVEHVGDGVDDEGEDYFSDPDEIDEEEYDYSDDEPPSEPAYHPHDRDVTDFLTFGNSLQVKGGILTVADDLLKNDGKRFIEMMEQLAERRMAREEDAREHFSRGYGHPNDSYSSAHNHPPPDDDDDYDDEEEDDEDYDDSQDEEYEEEEDVMTEEQRMEEGRRMFQIFAARMFEQRVLSAYKEKVAKERQAKLLEELEEEDRREDQQKARKAKNAAKKKEKAAEKKKAAAEDKARKEAEKAAEEAARLEAEQQKAAEQKRKAEEKRKQKEAQKKAEEEARLKKEADRQRRIHEQREKQAEAERKARETKDREKKLKEEQKAKEKEVREQREREALERKEKQERDKREKEARAARALKEAQEAKEAREKAKDEAQKAPIQPSPPAKRGQAPITVPILPSQPANYSSPKVPVATPIMPKLPTPIRSRALSQQQDSASASSVPSQEASPHPEPTSQTSPRPIGQQRKESGSLAGSLPHPTQTSSPASGMSGHPTPVNFPPPGMAPPPGFGHPPPPGFPGRMDHNPMLPPGFRPPGMMPPPGMNGPGGRVFSPVPMPPPGFSPDQFPPGQGFPMKEGPLPPTHQRQGSASFDAPAQPIGRPAPIGRPGSNNQPSQSDKDDEAQHLGSRALLGDDEPLEPEFNPGSLRNQPPGPRPFGGPFVETGFNLAHNPWGPSPGGPSSFGPPGFQNTWGGAPGMSPVFGMTTPAPGFSPVRPGGGLFGLRAMVCHACRELAATGPPDAEGFIDVPTLKHHIEELQGPIEIDLTLLFETEGNASNGGGTFETKDIRGTELVRWRPENSDSFVSQPRSVGAPGQIGSPAAAVRGM